MKRLALFLLGFVLVFATLTLLLSCKGAATSPTEEGGWTDHPDRPPQRRAPVATDVGGEVHTGYILVPYPKIVTDPHGSCNCPDRPERKPTEKARSK